jgi:hypothetical protein
MIMNIQSKALALGVNGAPTDPPESINQYPFAVTYVSDVAWERTADWRKGIYKIVTEVHWSRQNLPKAIEQCVGFGDTFADAILSDPRLGDTVDTVVELRGKFGWLQWGDQRDIHIGWSFEVTVKIEYAM